MLRSLLCPRCDIQKHLAFVMYHVYVCIVGVAHCFPVFRQRLRDPATFAYTQSRFRYTSLDTTRRRLLLTCFVSSSVCSYSICPSIWLRSTRIFFFFGFEFYFFWESRFTLQLLLKKQTTKCGNLDPRSLPLRYRLDFKNNKQQTTKYLAHRDSLSRGQKKVSCFTYYKNKPYLMNRQLNACVIFGLFLLFAFAHACMHSLVPQDQIHIVASN